MMPTWALVSTLASFGPWVQVTPETMLLPVPEAEYGTYGNYGAVQPRPERPASQVIYCNVQHPYGYWLRRPCDTPVEASDRAAASVARRPDERLIASDRY